VDEEWMKSACVAPLKAKIEQCEKRKTKQKSFLHRFGQIDAHIRFLLTEGSSYTNGPTII
jgi:hypothetical protein